MKSLAKKKRSSGNRVCPEENTPTCFCFFPKITAEGGTPGGAPVYLNVYDITPLNGCLYWAGIGVFHSGVEVHGIEYSFGAHDFQTSGIFEVEPRQCPGFVFRKSILIGYTSLDPKQVRDFIELHSVRYYGSSYHLITKNCNHFCKDICHKLTSKSIPKWVNRLAKIGSLFRCILPEGVGVAAVQDESQYESYNEEKQRLRSPCSFLSSVSSI